jgi:HSP20 family molecular chaperone IbpA
MFLPPADIYETRDNIVVLAEMPGAILSGLAR